MRSKWYFLVVGLAMVLGPSLANSQFGQPGGAEAANPFGGGRRPRRSGAAEAEGVPAAAELVLSTRPRCGT